MRFMLILTCVLMSLAGGCSSMDNWASFDGEWLEEGVVQPASGWEMSSTGERRMAIQFRAPSMVKTGLYVNRTGVVDAGTVQEDSYFLFDWFKAAQFGGMTARVKGDRLTAIVVGGPERHFTRVKSGSIFPPPVLLPQIIQIDPKDAPVADTKYASTSGR